MSDEKRSEPAGIPAMPQPSPVVWPPPPTKSPGYTSAYPYPQYRQPPYAPLTRLCTTLVVMLLCIILIDLVQSGLQVQPKFAIIADKVSLSELFWPMATGIVFLRWTYLAYRNLRAFGTIGLKCTPGFAVGCFFIPIYNLVRPLFVFAEIWKVSDPEYLSGSPDWQKTKLPPMIVCWWLSWICANIMDLVVAIPQLSDNIIANSAEFLLLFISAILAIRIIRKITARQEEKFRICIGDQVGAG
jgi:hypothetical protein